MAHLLQVTPHGGRAGEAVGDEVIPQRIERGQVSYGTNSRIFASSARGL